MFSPKIKYFLYGTLLSASLITLVTQATTTDGVFGIYFQNIVNDASGCGTKTTIIGFNSTPGSTYGTQRCTTFQNIVKSVFGSSSGGVNKAVVGFDANGNPLYGNISDNIWIKSGSDISYTGGYVGIGNTNPLSKLDVTGKVHSNSTIASDSGVTVTTKDYVDNSLISLCTSIGGTWVSAIPKCVVPPAVTAIYTWQYGSYGTCSKTCGGGTQTAPVICVNNNGTTVADMYCTGVKPASKSQACNIPDCPVTRRTISTTSTARACSDDVVSLSRSRVLAYCGGRCAASQTWCYNGTCNANLGTLVSTAIPGARLVSGSYFGSDLRDHCGGQFLYAATMVIEQ